MERVTVSVATELQRMAVNTTLSLADRSASVRLEPFNHLNLSLTNTNTNITCVRLLNTQLL